MTHFGTKWRDRLNQSHVDMCGSQPIRIQEVRSTGGPRRPRGSSRDFTRLVAFVRVRRVTLSIRKVILVADGPWQRNRVGMMVRRQFVR